MSQNRILLLIAAVIIAAGLTVALVLVLGINPLMILIVAMVLSVVARLWSRSR